MPALLLQTRHYLHVTSIEQEIARVLVVLITVLHTTTATCYREVYNINYSLPMFENCRVKQVDGGRVQLIPKLIPRRLGSQRCHGRLDETSPPGYGVCRIPDCYDNPCQAGWCEETMESYECHCPPGLTGRNCETQSTTDGTGEEIRSQPSTLQTSKAVSITPAAESVLDLLTSERITSFNPLTSAPVTTSDPVTPSLVTSSDPMTSASVTTSDPVMSSPVTTSGPMTPAPVTTSDPMTSAPVTTSDPVTPAPVTTFDPMTSAPVTTSDPVTPSPVTSSDPMTSAPMTTSDPVMSSPLITSDPVTSQPMATSDPVTSLPETSYDSVTSESVSSSDPVESESVNSYDSAVYWSEDFSDPVASKTSSDPVTSESVNSSDPVASESVNSSHPVTSASVNTSVTTRDPLMLSELANSSDPLTSQRATSSDHVTSALMSTNTTDPGGADTTIDSGELSIELLCPTNWILFNNSCYRYFDTLGNWLYANSTCSGLHFNQSYAHLASVHSAEENAFLYKLRNTSGFAPDPSLENTDASGAWLGLTGVLGISDNMYYYTWSDGSIFDYVNWGTRQAYTTYLKDSCCQFSRQFPEGISTMDWYKGMCADHRPFICQVQPYII